MGPIMVPGIEVSVFLEDLLGEEPVSLSSSISSFLWGSPFFSVSSVFLCSFPGAVFVISKLKKLGFALLSIESSPFFSSSLFFLFFPSFPTFPYFPSLPSLQVVETSVKVVNMRQVGLVYKKSGEAAARKACEVIHWLRDKGVEPLMDSEHEEDIHCSPKARVVDGKDLGASTEFVISLGGDGTLLYVAGLLNRSHVPILGVHMGTLGFLTQFQESDLEDGLQAALAGALEIEKRMRLEILGNRSGQPLFSLTAANDVVISQGKMARLIEMDVYMNGLFMTSYRADGLIVSTPTGSTGYNLSAGGPIIEPGLDAVVLTPICPHSLSQRPTVLPSTGKISVVVGGNTNRAYATVDGQSGHVLSAGDIVEVSRSGFPLNMFRSPKRTFFDILRAKLLWGGDAMQKNMPEELAEERADEGA